MADHELVGAWVSNALASGDVLLGVVAHAIEADNESAWLGGGGLGDDTGGGLQFSVQWEDGTASPWSSSECVSGLLPVGATTGRPLLCWVNNAPKTHNRYDEWGVVTRVHRGGYELRFPADYEQAKDPAVGVVFTARGPTRAADTVLWFHGDPSDGIAQLTVYDVTQARLPEAEAMPDFFDDFFKAVLVGRLADQHPALGPALRLLGDAASLRINRRADRFIGVPVAVLMPLHRAEPYPGTVTEWTAGPHQRTLFRVDFEGDDDHVPIDAMQLLGWASWANADHAALCPPSTTAGPTSPPALDLVARDPHYGSPATIQDCARCGHRWRCSKIPPELHELCQSCANSDPLAAATERVRLHLAAVAAAAGHRQLVPGFMPAHVEAGAYEEITGRLMEGIDARAHPDYLAANPPRVRSIGHIEAHASLAFDAPRRAVRHRECFEVSSVEETRRWQAVIATIAGVRTSTQRSYNSSRANYEECCRKWTPPCEPWPCTFITIGTWLGKRWALGRLSNINNTKPLVSALTHHMRHALKLHTHVTPYPGLGPMDRYKVGRICKALARLEDRAVRRSIPLTALLLRLFLEEKALDPGAGVGFNDMTRQQICDLRDVARYGLNRVCMLRKDDCTGLKQRYSMYTELREYAGKLRVPPGKAHEQLVDAQVPGITTALTDTWRDYLSPGYAMSRWRACYASLLGAAPGPDLPLFPVIGAGGKPTATPCPPAALQQRLRGLCPLVGLPPAFSARLTYHGFRSGGCTDAVRAGTNSATIQHQGRWSSEAFKMYIHCYGDIMRSTFEAVIRKTTQTRGERTFSDQARTYQTIKQWFRDHSDLGTARVHAATP